MSKGRRLRELQEEVNMLKRENTKLKEEIKRLRNQPLELGQVANVIHIKEKR